jgi:outer membrane protein OmpA-like peptidoglycan-associated protein
VPRHLSHIERSLTPLAFAALISFACVAPAFAQSGQLAQVRVTRDDVEIRSSQYLKREPVMRAPKDTVLDVFYVEGDRYEIREDNWYWVVLPRDPYGARRTGWVSGRYVELMPFTPAAAASAVPVAAVDAGRAAAAPTPEAAAANRPAETRRTAAPAPAPAATIEISEVVLKFAFDKSDLSDQAKASLDRAFETLKAQPQAVSIALEGHADAVGTEPYNAKLGLARAAAVGRYLSERHQVPAGRISVASFGETQPATSNDSAEGRAENRRVVVKVGG